MSVSDPIPEEEIEDDNAPSPGGGGGAVIYDTSCGSVTGYGTPFEKWKHG